MRFEPRERAKLRESGTRSWLPRPGSRWVESESEREEHKFLSDEAVHWMHDRVDHSGEAAATKHKYHYQDDEGDAGCARLTRATELRQWASWALANG